MVSLRSSIILLRLTLCRRYHLLQNQRVQVIVYELVTVTTTVVSDPGRWPDDTLLTLEEWLGGVVLLRMLRDVLGIGSLGSGLVLTDHVVTRLTIKRTCMTAVRCFSFSTWLLISERLLFLRLLFGS